MNTPKCTYEVDDHPCCLLVDFSEHGSVDFMKKAGMGKCDRYDPTLSSNKEDEK